MFRRPFKEKKEVISKNKGKKKGGKEKGETLFYEKGLCA